MGIVNRILGGEIGESSRSRFGKVIFTIDHDAWFFFRDADLARAYRHLRNMKPARWERKLARILVRIFGYRFFVNAIDYRHGHGSINRRHPSPEQSKASGS